MREQRDGGWQGDAVVIDVIEVRKDVIAEARWKRAGSWEAGNGWGKETDLAKTKADPASRVDGIVVEGRSSGTHVELPRVVTPVQCKGGEVDTAGEIGRKGDE